jgi:hypothetical protein
MKKLSAIIFCAVLTLVTVPYTAEAKAEPTPKPTISKPVIKNKSLTPKEIARRASRSRGHNLLEWKCLDKLWTQESHFNPRARNKRSGAYGIAQFMPQTWHNYKVKKTSDAALQIKYGLRYIERRYGSPCAAWRHWRKHHWY